MTTMNPLPPQAYTKETLLKAYSWLQSQTDNIKELATTPDILVSLYLKAKLNGNAALETPSIQNFKTELKNLAGIMGEFDGQPVQQPIQTPQPQPAAASVQSMGIPDLDYRSLTMLREVRSEFNLSSDQEALRLLISVGHKKLKSLS